MVVMTTLSGIFFDSTLFADVMMFIWSDVEFLNFHYTNAYTFSLSWKLRLNGDITMLGTVASVQLLPSCVKAQSWGLSSESLW